MHAFELARPGTLDEAIKALAGSEGAVALGGGTDLINRMKDDVIKPPRVVDLGTVKEFAGIGGDAAAGVTIGAGTKLAAVLENPVIKQSYPALWEAVRRVGSPQIRNMATVGGNLCQKPRCWYYRAGFGLLAMREGKSLVREGDNRYHAVFMTDGDALFVNPSNLASALVALDAKVTVNGPGGERTLALTDLYRVPKAEGESETSLAKGELVTRVALPKAAGKNAAYFVTHKQAHDWPLVGASVSLEQPDAPRVIVYGVAPVPWRSASAEEALKGKAIDATSAAAAAKAATDGAKPLSKNGYKVPLIAAAVRRATLLAAGQKWEG